MNYTEIEHYTEHEQNRKHIDDEIVRQWAEEAYIEAEEALRKIDLLCLLEGQVHADNYHRAKNQFRQMGLHYGFISPHVRKHKGSNDFIFSERKLKEEKGTGFGFGNIPRSRGSYTQQIFKKYSSHDDELELAVLTERHFKRLRKVGYEIKDILRQLKRQLTRKMTRKQVREDDK